MITFRNRADLLAFLRQWRKTGESLEILERDLWGKFAARDARIAELEREVEAAKRVALESVYGPLKAPEKKL